VTPWRAIRSCAARWSRLALTLGLLATAVAAGADQQPGSLRRAGPGAGWIRERLSIGLRLNRFWLQETRRTDAEGFDNANLKGNFLGSLWGLDAVQHYFPSPYLEYRVASGFGLQLSYDQARAKTLDWANDDHTLTAGDGDVEIRGGTAAFVARYRNRTRLTPYASVGFAWYRSHFFTSPGWATPGRYFVVQNTDGWFVAAGLRFRVTPHVGADVAYRHSYVGDVAARAYLRADHYRGGAFPMRRDVLDLGLSYEV
jgi:opacity protein-like surface antigen